MDAAPQNATGVCEFVAVLVIDTPGATIKNLGPGQQRKDLRHDVHYISLSMRRSTPPL